MTKAGSHYSRWDKNNKRPYTGTTSGSSKKSSSPSITPRTPIKGTSSKISGKIVTEITPGYTLLKPPAAAVPVSSPPSKLKLTSVQSVVAESGASTRVEKLGEIEKSRLRQVCEKEISDLKQAALASKKEYSTAVSTLKQTVSTLKQSLLQEKASKTSMEESLLQEQASKTAMEESLKEQIEALSSECPDEKGEVEPMDFPMSKKECKASYLIVTRGGSSSKLVFPDYFETLSEVSYS